MFKAAQYAFRLETAWHGLCIPWWRSMWTCVVFDSVRKRKSATRHWATGRMLRRGPTSLPSLPPPPSGDHIKDLVRSIAAQYLNGRSIALRKTLPTVTPDPLADLSLAAAAIPPLVYKPTSAMSSLDSLTTPR
ncbi:hypothetical protein DFH09DRAFT_1097880 [Mycena vulgaris]|nr:hypothetical protein DFH09DRAFT_1097880 [Mycena vulgaris]